MVWKLGWGWRKLNRQRGEEKAVQTGNTEPTKAEHWYQGRQEQRVQDVEKRKVSSTKRMVLDFLKHLFSGWMLGEFRL